MKTFIRSREIKKKLKALLGKRIASTFSWIFLTINRYIRIIKILSPIQAIKFITSREKSLIIETEYGGLGDNLFYTPVARLAKESKKYIKVYFSNVSPFRKEEHKEFLWGMNPYVDGFINLPGIMCKKIPDDNDTRLKLKHRKKNIIDLIIESYCLAEDMSMTDPEIYYTPKNNEYCKNKVLFDPNWITDLYDEKHIFNEVTNYFNHKNIHVDLQLEPKNGRVGIKSAQIIKDTSFSEYCDLIASCAEFYCFASGSAVLAASLGVKANVFYTDEVNDIFLFSKNHNYIKLSGKNYG
jgi:hypothetical protein